MSKVVCPHCGSIYVVDKGIRDSLNLEKHDYYCQTCKKNFTIEKEKESASGEWLATFYKGLEYVKLYRTPSGNFSVDCYIDSRYSSREITPKLYWNQNSVALVVFLDLYKTPNDPNGNLISVSRVELNKNLAEKAKLNLALKTVGNDNCTKIDMPSANFNHPENYQLVKDVVQALKEVIGLSGGIHDVTGGGCYIATAVYGSYDCPQVWTLRRFRDYKLAKSWYGRAFIKTYYTISPTLVKWFGETNWFKNIWKNRLDKMVVYLQNEGFESSPYEDIKW